MGGTRARGLAFAIHRPTERGLDASRFPSRSGGKGDLASGVRAAHEGRVEMVVIVVVARVRGEELVAVERSLGCTRRVDRGVVTDVMAHVIGTTRFAMVVRVVRQMVVNHHVRDGPGRLSEQRQQQDEGHSGSARGDHGARRYPL